MKIENRANLVINTVGLSLIAICFIFKLLFYGNTFFDNARSLIYMLFFVLWLFTVARRVMQRNIRNILLSVGGLELFWVIARTAKYQVLTNETALRYAWYLYYLPQLMIPSLCLLLSILMGKPENHKPKRIAYLFPIVSFALFLLVMTNDIHSLVFVMPLAGVEGTMVGNYSYGAGFVVIVGYVALNALACYGILFVKCRKLHGMVMRFLPLIPLTLEFIMSALVMVGFDRLFGFFQLDITVISCFCITLTLEACIQCGLIPTNNGYDELFRLSGIRAVITDRELSPLICSDTYGEISRDDMKKALKAPVMLNSGSRVSCAEIKRGYVLWQDDISELSRVLSSLSETNDYLQGKSSAIQQANDYRKKERRLIEKNRLYNRILTQTKPEIERYSELIEQLAAEPDPEKSRALAVRIAFVSAFIKRRDNLIFLSEEGEDIDPHELAYCVEESLSNLRLCGAECSCSLAIEKPLAFSTISRLYEGFYRIVSELLDVIKSVCVYLTEEDGGAAVTMRFSCAEGADLSHLERDNVRVRKEENEWAVTVCARE